MKFVSFRPKEGGAVRGGVLEGNRVRPLASTGCGDDVLGHIASGSSTPKFDGEAIDLASVQLVAPLQQPPRIFAIGLNYREHAAESKMVVQAVPTVFLKLPSSICGPDDTVLLPKNAKQTDYEAEFAVVIGKAGSYIDAADWEQHVFGYTIVNDVSARDIQLATSQWILGKNFPTFTPMGPVVVTRDEIADPHALDIKLTLTGEVMQSANTRDLIFRIPELIAHISSIVPLQAGDIISTGTPPGVGLGRTPQRWLVPGDDMVIEIEGVGTLHNPVQNA